MNEQEQRVEEGAGRGGRMRTRWRGPKDRAGVRVE